MQVVRRFGDVEVAEIACKSVLNRVAGMPFGWSINPYTGCFHQCVFCYARSTHAYRELDGVNDWGARLSAKVNAPAVLRRELARPGWRGDAVAIGTATDPYQSVEGRYRITRGILEELARARNPAHLITRSPLIVRDIDVLSALARRAPFHVAISIPTLDEDLARKIEPTVAPPRRRIEAIRRLASAGIRVGVAVAPVLPNLTDDEATISGVLAAAVDAGASNAWHSVLNLGAVTRDAFFAFLTGHDPETVALYQALYGNGARYAPASYTRIVDERVRTARRAAPFAPPETIVPERSPVLSLFGNDDQPDRR